MTRSADTYRGARREDAKAKARDEGHKLREVWTGRAGGPTGAAKRKPPTRYTPHQGEKERARRLAAFNFRDLPF